MKKNYRYEGQYESKKKHNIQELCEFILEQNYGNTISDTDLAKIFNRTKDVVYILKNEYSKSDDFNPFEIEERSFMGIYYIEKNTFYFKNNLEFEYRNLDLSNLTSSNLIGSFAECNLPDKKFLITSGCSLISLSIKCL